MAEQPATAPILVYSPKGLAQLLEQLRRRSLVAIDTESDSLYRYYPRICLIQLSLPAEPAGTAQGGATGAADGYGAPAGSSDLPDPLAVVDYLIDPLRLNDLSALGQALLAPGLEVVMHAAENDMLLLYRNFGFTFRQIFDTQLAARILGWKQVGLASILEAQFGTVSDKRMQRTNWGKRPLTPEQIAYAQMDTHYLPALRCRLIDELQLRGRWEEAQEAFAHLASIDYSARPVEDRTFWSMRSVRDVPAERLNVLESLWLWREQEARQQNRPPFKVLSDTALIDLALHTPAERAGLNGIQELSAGQVDRYGAALLRTIQEGRQRPQPLPPEYASRVETALDKAVLNRFDALRKWRSEAARVRDVAPDIVLPNSTLLAIAQHNPTSPADLQAIPELGAWKATTYGPDILATLRTPEQRRNR